MKQVRKEYKLTLQEMDNLLKACNPPPMATKKVFGSAPPLTAQERANIAWTSLGKAHGFDPSTVQPVEGKDHFHFSAVPIEYAFEDVEFKEVQ